MIAGHDRRGTADHVKSTHRTPGRDGDVAGSRLNGSSAVHHQAPCAGVARQIAGLNGDVAIRLDGTGGALVPEDVVAAGVGGGDVDRAMRQQGRRVELQAVAAGARGIDGDGAARGGVAGVVAGHHTAIDIPACLPAAGHADVAGGRLDEFVALNSTGPPIAGSAGSGDREVAHRFDGTRAP